jgi:hypothetical protein
MTLKPIHGIIACGCKTLVPADRSGVEIEFCALHAAAETMQKALKAAKRLPGLYTRIAQGDSIYHDGLIQVTQTIHAEVREAIAKSKGEEIKCRGCYGEIDPAEVATRAHAGTERTCGRCYAKAEERQFELGA